MGKKFGANVQEGIRRYDVDVIMESPAGPLFVYQVKMLNGSMQYKTVCKPFLANLTERPGPLVLDIGDSVPLEKRKAASDTVMMEGYKGEIVW